MRLKFAKAAARVAAAGAVAAAAGLGSVVNNRPDNCEPLVAIAGCAN
jgi:hypothetical protein